MKLSGYAVFAFIVSALVFYLFYIFFNEVVVASTGYNAMERGLFGWEYSFTKHELLDDRISSNSVLVSSVSYFKFSKLLAEVGLCGVIGIVATALLFLFNKLVNAINNNLGGNEAG